MQQHQKSKRLMYRIEQRKENGPEGLFKEITTENFSHMWKSVYFNILEDQSSLIRFYQKQIYTVMDCNLAVKR